MADSPHSSAPPPGAGIVGVLLAGGRAQRMGGGDKCLRQLGGRTLLDHVIERARPQVETLLINANGDPNRFERFGLPVAADVVAGYAGPLAGILTGMTWALDNHPDCAWVASFATDAPFFPRDLVERMRAAVDGQPVDMVCACSGTREHPVFALWPVRLAGALQEAMVLEDMRKIDLWTARYRLAEVTFETEPFDPFFNLNHPEDLEEAELLLTRANTTR